MAASQCRGSRWRTGKLNSREDDGDRPGRHREASFFPTPGKKKPNGLARLRVRQAPSVDCRRSPGNGCPEQGMTGPCADCVRTPIRIAIADGGFGAGISQTSHSHVYRGPPWTTTKCGTD